MTDQENIAAQVLDARQKFGTSRIADAALKASSIPALRAMGGDPELNREFFVAGARAMLDSILAAHKLAGHYPDHGEVFQALMHTLKDELDEHVVDLLQEILTLLKRMPE
ncbi:MAG: hypothetical protein ACKOX6_00750 [Bdellovibrio sp.]